MTRMNSNDHLLYLSITSWKISNGSHQWPHAVAGIVSAPTQCLSPQVSIPRLLYLQKMQKIQKWILFTCGHELLMSGALFFSCQRPTSASSTHLLLSYPHLGKLCSFSIDPFSRNTPPLELLQHHKIAVTISTHGRKASSGSSCYHFQCSQMLSPLLLFKAEPAPSSALIFSFAQTLGYLILILHL